MVALHPFYKAYSYSPFLVCVCVGVCVGVCVCLSAKIIFSALYKWSHFDIYWLHINNHNIFVTAMKCALNGRMSLSDKTVLYALSNIGFVVFEHL